MAESDALYHRLFSHPLMVEQLVRNFVPEAMALDLDFTGMERVTAKFHARNGQRRESDVIWRLPSRGGLDVYLYLLVEFQSQSDWWMAVRAQVYQGLLWQHIIAGTRLKAGDRLPPVLLLVLHNGDTRWSAPADLGALIALPADSPLWPWQPQVRYYVLDMGAVPGGDLAGRDDLAALLFRLERRLEPGDLAGLIDLVVGWFRRHPGHEELRGLFTELVRQAVAGVGVAVPVPDDLLEMKAMLATQGEVWKRQWKAEGRTEGVLEGQARALARQLERRFGPLPAEVRTRLADAGQGTLDGWLDRVLDAATLDAVFDDTAAH